MIRLAKPETSDTPMIQTSILVPFQSLPGEGWEPDATHSEPTRPSLIPDWLQAPAPTVMGRLSDWSLPDTGFAWDYHLMAPGESTEWQETGLRLDLHGADLVSRLNRLEPGNGMVDVIPDAIDALTDHIARQTRHLYPAPTPIFSLSLGEDHSLQIAVELLVLGNLENVIHAQAPTEAPLALLQRGETIYLAPGDEVGGRGVKEVATAFGLSLLAALPQPMLANVNPPILPIVKTTPASEGNLREVPMQTPLNGQDPVYANTNLLGQAREGNTEIVVDVSDQRARLYVDGQLALDTPVSTARAGKYTPRGTFNITQKVKSGKRSTIYGCLLPYWMRLDQSAIGLHVGELPGAPASAGCIRLPVESASLIFAAAASGTKVVVQS